jgi:hypothetical protein
MFAHRLIGAVATVVVVGSFAGRADGAQASFEVRPRGAENAPIEISFEGRVHEPPLDLSLPSNDPAVSLVRRTIAAGKETLASEVLPLWAPAERADIETMLNDPQAVERNRAFSRRVVSTHLHAEIRYGDVTLLAVEQRVTEGKPALSLYPVVWIEGQPFLSNRLQEDSLYPFLRAVLIRRFVPAAL